MPALRFRLRPTPALRHRLRLCLRLRLRRAPARRLRLRLTPAPRLRLLCGRPPLAVRVLGLEAPQRERMRLPPASLLALHTDSPAAQVLGHDYALPALKLRLRLERVRPDSNDDARGKMTIRLRISLRLAHAACLRRLTPAARLRLLPPGLCPRLLRVPASRRRLLRPPELHAAP
eukprot:scaffold4298_cov68-Phaeocystis_antarctica.AAC.1